MDEDRKSVMGEMLFIVPNPHVIANLVTTFSCHTRAKTLTLHAINASDANIVRIVNEMRHERYQKGDEWARQELGCIDFDKTKSEFPFQTQNDFEFNFLFTPDKTLRDVYDCAANILGNVLSSLSLANTCTCTYSHKFFFLSLPPFCLTCLTH